MKKSMNQDSSPNDVSIPLAGGEIAVHPKCSEIDAAAFSVGITFHDIGTVAEQASEDGAGRRVDYRPAGGGTSLSATGADGSYRAELSGALPKGKAAEPHAQKVLMAALEAAGHDVALLRRNDDDDARGKDCVLLVDGKPCDVQLVTMPADSNLWKELSSKGSAATSGDLPDAVALVRTSLEKKKDWWKGCILALDAANLGALSSPAVVDAYLAAHGDPNTEFGFAQTWIVGPTVGSTFEVA
jgi:hypothetical protein